MALTLEYKKNDPKTLILLWDGEFWREVSKWLFWRELNKFSSQLTWEEFLGQYQALEQKLAKRQAIAYLAKRSYLSTDLERKLLAQGLSPEATRTAIAHCQEKGYINDQQQIARLIAKQQRKGLGAKAIHFKLRQKKVPEGLLQQGLKKTELSEKEALEQWLRKHERKIPRNNPLEKKKLMAKLMRRGFSADLVFELLRSI